MAENKIFSVTRRQFFLSGKLSTELAISLRSIVVRVNVLFDQAPHRGKELTSDQRSLFQRYHSRRQGEGRKRASEFLHAPGDLDGILRGAPPAGRGFHRALGI